MCAWHSFASLVFHQQSSGYTHFSSLLYAIGAMWIKEPDTKLSESFSQNVNFLYKEESIYIMDNHLCAAWAWLQELDINNSHKLFHIDRHHDLSIDEAHMKELILDKNVHLSDLTFEEYCELSYKLDYSHHSYRLFQWDNYIRNIQVAYPSFYEETIFSFYDRACVHEDFITNEVSFDLLPDNISYWINREATSSWILNLDIDYFFMNLGEQTTQVFTDEYIVSVAESIKRAIDNINVLTISLSPECCGGWEKSIRVTNLICEILDLKFTLEHCEIEDI